MKDQFLNNKKTGLYFLDEMSLAAAWQVNLSRLKLKTRLFVDQEITQTKNNVINLVTKSLNITK